VRISSELSSCQHCLRFFFLIALFRIRAFLLNLSKHLCPVFHLIPDIKAHKDRSGLLSRRSDTIAGPRIDLYDLFCCVSFSALKTSLAK
jgi:hypothetical protein